MNKELELMLEDYIDNHKNVIIKDVYIKIYDDYGLKNFQTIFSFFHQELNSLFSFMNDKSRNSGHYNADESRYLLKIIDELRDFLQVTNETEYKVTLEQEYIEAIKIANTFLKISGGSLIPDDYKILNIIKFKPIFHFKTFKPKGNNIEKHIKTEANFEDNTISIILKKEVFSHIEKLLNTGNYYNAVEESYKIVRKKLKAITGKEKAHEGFKETNYELIFGHGPTDEAENDFFEGVKFLHMAIQKLRNEKAHKPAEDIDKNLAIHYIVLASLAYDLIDK